MIRQAEAGDAEAIARIYNPYVLDTTVTFEEQAVSPGQIAERLRGVGAAGLPWLVDERDGRVAGYAYAGPWKARAAYRLTVECAVYVEAAAVGRGVGRALYGELLPLLRGRGAHAAVACLSLPNPASVALHERFGFEKVGHFREVGRKFGRWLDVGYWQLLL